MRLGGFVIHGDDVAAIPPCLESLASVCDEIVSIHTGSTDAPAKLAAAHGFRVLRRPWEGYGAARAEAIPALSGCDWVFFLDSDEWLEPPAREAIRRFKKSPCDAPYVALTRRDWGGRQADRFLYRTERHVRLVRLDHARWTRSMIVHEALPAAPTVTLDAVIEHLFAPDLDDLRRKLQVYALLWALRAHRDGRRRKAPIVERGAHLIREMVLKGALFRGRREALSLANLISGYHANKYRRLGEVAAGEHAALMALLETDRLRDLFRLVVESVAETSDGTAAPGHAAPRPPRPGVVASLISEPWSLLRRERRIERTAFAPEVLTPENPEPRATPRLRSSG